MTAYLASVASQGSMLTLRGRPGDWAKRTDTGTAWFITGSDPSQIGSWTEAARAPRNRTAVADASYTILTTDEVVAYTSLTAPRTATLPNVSAVGVQSFTIKDESGSCSPTNTITITPASGTIDGASTLVLSTPYGVATVFPNGTNWFTRDSIARSPDRVYATSSGTWTNPSPSVAKMVRVRGMCGGCGGGSGRRGAAGTLRTGGAGGTCGSPFEMWFLTTDLTSTVAYTVGAGGGGGAAVTANDTDGNIGTSGGNTFFGAATTTYRAFASNASTGGGRAGNSTGAAAGGASLQSGPGGGASSATGAAGTAGGVSTLANGWLLQVGTGGGAGGGITTGDVTSAGGAGGAGGVTIVGGAAGTAGGGAGGDGPAGPVVPSTGGLGGGGGGSSTSGAGGNGGNGAFPGGGGGGGGASLNGANSGAGGAGAGGYIEVVTYL